MLLVIIVPEMNITNDKERDLMEGWTQRKKKTSVEKTKSIERIGRNMEKGRR